MKVFRGYRCDTRPSRCPAALARTRSTAPTDNPVNDIGFLANDRHYCLVSS